MSSKRARFLFVFIVLLCVAAGRPVLEAQRPERANDGGPRFFPDDPIWRDDDMRDIPPLPSFELSASYEFVRETFGGSARSFGPALNVNTLGEVPDSSWFTNRLGRRALTIEEVLRGPDTVDGPAAGPWFVTGRPDAGVTPKFTIRDARGDTYLFKLDPKVAPELPSSVELISTKIFHAAGYHVPEDYLVTFDPVRLQVAPGAMLRSSTGGRRRITANDVAGWLVDTPRTADGRIRVLASRYVPGRPVGQFRYTGTRADDPNDLYPHERRRELRGLRVFAAWLHHDDARALNSIDSQVEEQGRRYIRHYLQDFGSSLGSGSTAAQPPRGGYEYLIDGGAIAKGLFSLGLWQRGWMHARYPQHPSLGNIEADFFEPAAWKTAYPQPAFDRMDDADAFWAARIAARFNDEMLRSIVEIARLSDPDARRYLGDVLIARRNKVVAYWLTRTTPIGDVGISATPDGVTLTVTNAAVTAGVARDDGRYVAQWSAFDNTRSVATPFEGLERSRSGRLVVPAAAWGPRDASGARYAMVAIGIEHPTYPHWTRPVRVTLRRQGERYDVVGIERPTGGADASS